MKAMPDRTPQTFVAVSTTGLSFLSSSSSVRGLPCKSMRSRNAGWSAIAEWWAKVDDRQNHLRIVVRDSVNLFDERTVQVIRKGPFLVECAVVVDGEAVAVFGAGPAWLQATGRAANKAIFGLAAAQLEGFTEARAAGSAHGAR